MRKKEKEITSKSEIEAIIRKAVVCRIAMSDNNIPYIVPVSFGYHDNAIYFHGSLKGQKIDIIKKNQNICFEFDINSEVLEDKVACGWDMKYQSVIGFGKAEILNDIPEKQNAMAIIMKQYTDKLFDFPEKMVKGTCVVKIAIDSMTGKQSGFSS